jgi:hypothetical protein
VVLGFAVLGVLASIVLWFEHWPAASACGIGLVLSSAVLRRTWLQREAVEPSSMLRERAGSLARLFPAAVVVMGHTHLPEVRATTAHSTYFNLGGWAEQEAADGASALRATHTHLVVTHAAQGTRAQLLAWDDGVPRPFQSGSS